MQTKDTDLQSLRWEIEFSFECLQPRALWGLAWWASLSLDTSGHTPSLNVLEK